MLKSSLRELLASYRASHKSVPDYPTVVYTNLGSIASRASVSYTPSRDGILVLLATGTEYRKHLEVKNGATDGPLLGMCESLYGGGMWAVVQVPVRKGTTVCVFNAGSEDSAAALEFHHFIGSA